VVVEHFTAERRASAVTHSFQDTPDDSSLNRSFPMSCRVRAWLCHFGHYCCSFYLL